LQRPISNRELEHTGVFYWGPCPRTETYGEHMVGLIYLWGI